MSFELQVALGIALLVWAGMPWSRWVRNARVLMALHFLKGVVPVALVRSGLLEGWSATVSADLLAWGVGFLTVWIHTLSAFRKAARVRAVGVSAGALLVLSPLAWAAGVVAAGAAWRIQKDAPESTAWIEVAAVLGAAAGIITVTPWSESLWIGAIWWALLLQRQEQHLELILAAQNRSARS